MSVRPVRLRREWNLWAPVSRLPPELLSFIFCYVCRAIVPDWNLSKEDYGFSFDWQEWMKISHICNMWREVAMNTVSLWSTLVVTRGNYKWAEECLRRSRQSSITLFADFRQVGKEHPSRTLLRELRGHLGRCRVLCLRLTTEDLADLLSQNETPHLVRFCYCHLSNSRSLPPLIGDSILHADSLRRLSISSCPIDWSASIFHRLTHLQLRDIPKESRLKCHDFVSFLLGMASLEVLHLSAFLQDGESDASHPDGKAVRKYLQNLKHVELDNNPPNIADFLSSLVIPPFCEVFINVEGYPETTAEEFLPVFSWVYCHFNPPKLGSSNASDAHQNYWRSLRIFHLDTFFGFQGYTIEENLEPNHVLFEHCIRLPNDADNDYNIRNLPRTLFTPLPISRIVYLEVAAYCHQTVLSKSMWIEIFGSILTLESICIEPDSFPFFKALSYDSGDSEFIPFPVLSSVIVRANRYLDCDTILKSLRWRFQLGAPLKKLVIEACATVPPSVLKQLRKVVRKVTVTDHESG